ncbi:MAG: hypothetical protein JWM43_910 [Acidobacteriaceae bacterium]|nr:hypothetical protein [Acidobacteriaceae bacterium]
MPSARSKGEGVLAWLWGATRAATVRQSHRTRMDASYQALHKGRNPLVSAERETRATHVREGVSVRVRGPFRVRSQSGQLQLRVAVSAKITNEPDVAVEVERDRGRSAIQGSNRPVPGGHVRYDAKVGVAKNNSRFGVMLPRRGAGETLHVLCSLATEPVTEYVTLPVTTPDADRKVKVEALIVAAFNVSLKVALTTEAATTPWPPERAKSKRSGIRYVHRFLTATGHENY